MGSRLVVNPESFMNLSYLKEWLVLIKSARWSLVGKEHLISLKLNLKDSSPVLSQSLKFKRLLRERLQDFAAVLLVTPNPGSCGFLTDTQLSMVASISWYTTVCGILTSPNAVI